MRLLLFQTYQNDLIQKYKYISHFFKTLRRLLHENLPIYSAWNRRGHRRITVLIIIISIHAVTDGYYRTIGWRTKVIFGPVEHRRNLTTRDVPLNQIVEKHFRVREVVLLGGRLNTTYPYLNLVTKKGACDLLEQRSGLNCFILKSGKLLLVIQLSSLIKAFVLLNKIICWDGYSKILFQLVSPFAGKITFLEMPQVGKGKNSYASVTSYPALTFFTVSVH